MHPPDEIKLSEPGKKKRYLESEPDNFCEPGRQEDESILRPLQEIHPKAVVLRSIRKIARKLRYFDLCAL